MISFERVHKHLRDKGQSGVRPERCAGANRRTAGVRTDIDRPDRELCTSAGADFAGGVAAAAAVHE